MKYQFIKISTSASVTILIFSILISFLLTVIFGERDFIILFNAVSDLGRSYFSPCPLLFDLGIILSGIFNFPFIFYFFLSYLFKVEKKSNRKGRKTLYQILTIFAFASVLNGNASLIGAGIFSLERPPYFLHYVFAFFLFMGYLFFALFLGLIYMIYKIQIPRYIAISGFVYFSSFFVFFFLASGSFKQIASLFEWILVYLMFSWYYLFSLKSIYAHNGL